MDWNKKVADIIKKIEQLEPKLTPAEDAVCDILCENIDIIPDSFFEDHTVEELNEHFGGKGDMEITPRVKQYMTLFQEQSFISGAMLECYADRATTYDVEALQTVLTTGEEPEPQMPYDAGSYEDILDMCRDLGMTPPDMFKDYEKFCKYLPKVWPNHPNITEKTFERVRKDLKAEGSLI